MARSWRMQARTTGVQPAEPFLTAPELAIEDDGGWVDPRFHSSTQVEVQVDVFLLNELRPYLYVKPGIGGLHRAKLAACL